MVKKHWEFSVGPVYDGKPVAPIGGQRATQDAAITAVLAIAKNMLASHRTLEIKVYEF